MARLARLALVPLTLAAAAPAVAQADAGVGQQSTAGVLGSFANVKLYPLAGSHIDPLSNVVGTTLGGIPVSTQPVADAFADGLPVKDLPVVSGLVAAAAPGAPAAGAVATPLDAAAAN